MKAKQDNAYIPSYSPSQNPSYHESARLPAFGQELPQVMANP